MRSSKPKVSVCVVAYNQEKYIGQCLQSIVSQITNFDIEVLVGDDCSTDGTRSIIQQFAERHPGVVKPIFHERNIGPHNNFMAVHNMAEGNYIAHVDGDDYCLPGKLQAQADVLDSNPGCNLVWHRMLIEKVDGTVCEGPLHGLASIGDIEFGRGDVIQYISVGFNSSKMYRKSVRAFDVPNFEIADYFANVEQVGDGVARFAGSKPYGVYRIGIGIASGGLSTRRSLANSFYYFSKKYPQYRLEANTAALMYLIADLKNFRRTWIIFLVAWVKTFHLGSPFRLLKSLRFIKNFRLKQ